MTVQTPRRPPSQDQDDLRRRRPERNPGELGVQQTRRKDPIWARLTVVLGALLMMASGAGIVGTKWLIGNTTDAIETGNLIGGAAKTTTAGGRAKTLKGPIDLLLMGLDARRRWAADELHADTIIILHIPATLDQAYLLSIPRDTEMHPGPFEKSRYPGGVAKATEVFFHGAQNGGGWAGGAQLLARTIKEETGVSFDGAAIINFNGFKGVIDSLGGVRMCVDQQVRSRHMVFVEGKPMYLAEARRTGKPRTPVVHKKGCRDMEGWEGLDYARQRYGLTHGDYDRQRHQQQLIKAMAKRASESGVMTNPIKISQIIQAAGKAFVLDTGGVPVADFIFTLKGIAANDLVLLRTNGGTFASNGNGREAFTQESKEMFTALKDDNLGEFILSHPDALAKEK